MRKHAVAISLILVVLLSACGAAVAENNTTADDANATTDANATAAAGGNDPDLEVDVELTDTNFNPITEARVGDVVVANIFATNWGPDDAYDVFVHLWVWLDQFNLIDWDATYGDFDPVDGDWYIDELPAGFTEELLLYLVAQDTGKGYVGAIILPLELDENPDNNYDWASIQILPGYKPPYKHPCKHPCKIPMQPTGVPLGALALTALMIFGGLITSKIKK